MKCLPLRVRVVEQYDPHRYGALIAAALNSHRNNFNVRCRKAIALIIGRPDEVTDDLVSRMTRNNPVEWQILHRICLKTASREARSNSDLIGNLTTLDIAYNKLVLVAYGRGESLMTGRSAKSKMKQEYQDMLAEFTLAERAERQDKALVALARERLGTATDPEIIDTAVVFEEIPDDFDMGA